MKIYGKLLLLVLICSTIYADPFADEQAQCQVSVARTNVRFLDPTTAVEDESTPTARLDLKGTEAPSIFTLENATNLLKTVGGATWKSAANFTPEALEYHLGTSPAAKIAMTVIHTPWQDGESTQEWATRLAANTAQEFGMIGTDLAKSLSWTAVLTTLTSEEGLSRLARIGLKTYLPALDFIAGEEIGIAAAQFALATPGYTLWLFSEEDLVVSKDAPILKGIAVEDTEDLAGVPTATKVASASDEDQASKPTFFQRVKARSAKVWGKLKHSVEVGTQRVRKSVQAAWDNFTLQNSKSYLAKKIPFSSMLFGEEKVEPKATPVSSVNIEESLSSAVNEKAKDIELKPHTFDATSANFDMPASSLAAAAA